MNLLNLYAQRQMAVKTVAARMVGARGGGLPLGFRPAGQLYRPANANSYGVGYDILSTGYGGQVSGFGLVNTGPGSQATLEAEYVASQSTFESGSFSKDRSTDINAWVGGGGKVGPTIPTLVKPPGPTVQTFEQWVANLETLSQTALLALIESLKRQVANSKAALANPNADAAYKAVVKAEYDDEVRRLNAALAVYEREVRADDARRINEARIREQQSGQTAEGGFSWWWLLAGAAGLAVVGVLYKGKK
jgi:hypothetical protein